jgi:DNA-binding NtrC family response regulator
VLVPEGRLLIVDDEAAVLLPMQRFFAGKGFEVRTAATLAEALQSYAAATPDAVLLDYALPDGDGLALLRQLKTLDAAVPMILLTAHGSIDLAVQAVKDGADNFLTKPVELPALLVMVERLLEGLRLRRTSDAERRRDTRRARDPFLGESPAIRRLAEQAARVASASVPVLIRGETGTGKGVLARCLHDRGPRSEQAFVDLNCAGLARELLESEVFGHQKGAFTGAIAAKAGLMEMAHRGTLFLDEIGDVDLQVQAKLLKAVEEMRFRRLGDLQDRTVDFRLVTATHRDLALLVQQEKFREDLFYRIRGVELLVPPLRERGRDVVLLARRFLSSIAIGRPAARLSPEAEEALLAYSWPGNIRELKNTLEHAVLLSPREVLAPEDFGDLLRERRPPGPPASRAPLPSGAALTLQEVERRHVESVLRQEDWTVQRAAEVLGISRTSLYERIRKYGLQKTGALRPDGAGD